MIPDGGGNTLHIFFDLPLVQRIPPPLDLIQFPGQFLLRGDGARGKGLEPNLVHHPKALFRREKSEQHFSQGGAMNGTPLPDLGNDPQAPGRIHLV
jgi:hypothetical protein